MKTGILQKIDDERKRLILIFMAIFLQWIIYLQIANDPGAGTWSMSNPDTMCTLSVARSWIHGHPLQIIPGEPFTTILSDLLSPLFFSAGYWLGFKSLSSFVLWAYIECVFITIFSSYFLWKFCKRYIPEVAFPSTLLSILFNGVFSNIFSTNFGFLFLFFWGALAYLESFPVFMTFSIIASLMRPEGIAIYIFLVILRLMLKKGDNKWKFVPALIPILMPFGIYKILSGSFLPQGVLPQNIFHYHGVLEGFADASSVVTDQIKGGLLGLYPAGHKIGAYTSAWLGTFPPLMFIFSIFGLCKYKREWLALIMIFLLFLLIGDAFTIYPGAHQNRHIQILTPFFFGFAFYFLYNVKIDRKAFYYFAIFFFFLLNSLQFYGSLSSKRHNIEQFFRHKEVTDYLLSEYPESHVLVQSMGPLYWSDGRLNLHILLTSVDPYLGKYVKYYNRNLEISEYVQKFYAKKVIYVDYYRNTQVDNWLRQFEPEYAKTFEYMGNKFAKVNYIDLNKIKDKPPYAHPYSDLDVGDPFSEKEYNYRYKQYQEKPVVGCLMEGKNFWDGGRPNVTMENFDLNVPETGGILICRYKGLFSGEVFKGDEASSLNLVIRNSNLKIFCNEIPIFEKQIYFSRDFFYLEIPLKEGGKCHFRIEGLFHSFHYWVYPIRET